MLSVLSTLCECYSNLEVAECGKVIKKTPLPFIPEEFKLKKDSTIKFLVKVNPKAKNNEKENTCKKSILILKMAPLMMCYTGGPKFSTLSGLSLLILLRPSLIL